MIPTPRFYLSLIFIICLVTACNNMHNNVIELQQDTAIDTTSITDYAWSNKPISLINLPIIKLTYVSQHAENVNTYHTDTVYINDGIQNYAWADNCNSIRISLKVSETDHIQDYAAHYRYQFHIDLGDGTQYRIPRPLHYNRIVHLYENVGIYKARIILFDTFTKTHKIIPFTMDIQESAICKRPIPQESPLYIVRLTQNATTANMEEISHLLDQLEAKKVYTYTYIFKGFAIEHNTQVIEALSTHQYIEQYSINQAVEGTQEVKSPNSEIEEKAWLTSEHTPYLHFSNATPHLSYVSKPHIYIVDTATYRHNDFRHRILEGVNFVVEEGGSVPYFGDARAQENCHNHATHVTGIAAGTIYGIATQAFIHPVQVLGCGGSSSVARVLAGLDWVTRNAKRPAVVNMSVGAQPSRHLDDAVKNSSRRGIFYAVSSGNRNSNVKNSCFQSPARAGRHSSIMTVGASNSQNNSVSNLSLQGPCIDIFALGERVVSAGIRHPDAIDIRSGSSMATPHIAGAAALYLQQYPYATPQEVHNHIIKHAIPNTLENVREGTVNLLYKIP